MKRDTLDHYVEVVLNPMDALVHLNAQNVMEKQLYMFLSC